jgi:hypothetical protein
MKRCLQSLFEDYPRDYSSNCPYSGSNAVSATVWGSVRKPGLSSAPPPSHSTFSSEPLHAISELTDSGHGSCSANIPAMRAADTSQC